MPKQWLNLYFISRKLKANIAICEFHPEGERSGSTYIRIPI